MRHASIYYAALTAGLVSAATPASAPLIAGTIVQPSGAPQITAPAGSIPLGQPCGADEQCAEGVQCFGSTAGTIRTCGSFNALCTNDSQCATNACNDGICRGFRVSSAVPSTTESPASTDSASSSTIIPGTILQPSGAPQVTAAAGSIPLGKPCGANEQCGAGVKCFGSTAGTIRTCGSYNAGCTSDSHCATNTCNNGLCNGFLASSLYPAYKPTSVPQGNNGSTVAHGGAASPTDGVAPSSPSSTLTPFTGGASVVRAAFSGLVVVVAGIVVCAL